MHSNDYNYITYPRNFASYKWAKPILVFILFLIIYLVGGAILVMFMDRTGASPVESLGLGYDSMNVSSVSGVLTNLGSVAWMLPSLALAGGFHCKGAAVFILFLCTGRMEF